MSNAFLGVGWAHPVRPARPEGSASVATPIATAAYEDSIRDAVWLILATARGERMMRPGFGCGIHDLVFATPGATTLGRVEREVRDALLRWEPRAEVLDVDVERDAAEPERVLIRVDYRVRTTNNQFNLVYPLYLERSGASVSSPRPSSTRARTRRSWPRPRRCWSATPGGAPCRATPRRR